MIQVPTTLLAAVDASVGGKTAVDLPAGKNLVGAFHQPSAVLCDPLLLETLPEAERKNGLGEVIKTAVIGDPSLLDTLLSPTVDWAEVIGRCIRVKKELVERDPLDTGARNLLNLGHTAAHAMERLSGFTLSHGLAVAKGTLLICRAAYARGLCPAEVPQKVLAVLDFYGMDSTVPYTAEELKEAALADKKRLGGVIRFVVPRALGRCESYPLPVEEAAAFLKAGLMD